MPSVGAGYYKQRLVVPPTFPIAPKGGTLLYFFVRDTGDHSLQTQKSYVSRNR
jgi:hypothetical protein